MYVTRSRFISTACCLPVFHQTWKHLNFTLSDSAPLNKHSLVTNKDQWAIIGKELGTPHSCFFCSFRSNRRPKGRGTSGSHWSCGPEGTWGWMHGTVTAPSSEIISRNRSIISFSSSHKLFLEKICFLAFLVCPISQQWPPCTDGSLAHCC